MSKIDTIVVHYTATFADQHLTAADIDEMHRARGWKMIGYHWIVRRDGTVEAGRPESMVGAHVGGQNTGKIGVSWIGGLERSSGANVGVDNRTPAQTEALINLIRDLLKRYPGAKVVGHRDLAATQCPGFDVPAWWASVQKKAAPAPAPVDPKAPAKSGNIGEQKLHLVRAGETWWSIAQMYGLGVADLARANGATPTDTLVAGRTLTLVIAPEVIEKPIVADPEDLGKPLAKSKTVGTWALAGIGSVTTLVGNFMGGLHWGTQLAITVATVGFAIYGIKRRADIAQTYRKLKAEFV